MYISKRHWTRELEENIRTNCDMIFDRKGKMPSHVDKDMRPLYDSLNKDINVLTKWGTKHITLLRFIDFSITVEGLHRAGQDDIDAHAKRFDNRIIRSSTRLATFDYEMSDYYKNKIIPTDVALTALGIIAPETLVMDGVSYVKTVNGYIREDMKDNADVKRGLYMLSIPSNFLFKVNLTEWAHIYKERNKNGGANPEVKECCEAICDSIEEFIPQFNRDLFEKIRN